MKMNGLSVSRVLLLIVVVVSLARCANVVAPTGGPVDEDPPIVVRSNPSNYSTHYDGGNVRIWFDEFVELKNLRQNLLVSPPLENDPEIRIRGRSIIMSLEDTLAPNTTYNFFFGDAIVDITEGNALSNFQFIASTGSYLDSLSVKGSVYNALTLLPEKNVFVMLYDEIYDSIPLKERPVYLTKTNEQGEFFISHIRSGEYLMFALRDENNNYIYDSRDEKIAFADSLVSPEFSGHMRIFEALEDLPEEPVTDTVMNGGYDTSSNGALTHPDSDMDEEAEIDTLAATDAHKVTHYNLYLFQERDTVQRVLSARLAAKGRLKFAFRTPVDSIYVEDYRDSLPSDWHIPEYSVDRDTLNMWFTGMERDSLFLKVYDRDVLLDTVNVSLVQRAARGRGAAREEAEPKADVRASSLVTGRNQPYFRNFMLESQTPLERLNTDSIYFFINDSIPHEMNFSFADHSSRHLELTTPLEPDSAYRLILYPGAVTDIFGHSNDTLNIPFRLNTPADYGSIIVNVTGLPQEPEQKQYILQLLDNDWKTVSEKIITNDGNYHFEHLAAREFRLRLIEDANRNERWDTGNYLKGTQPERVFIYPEKVQSRLNWEVEVLWVPLQD